MIVLEKPVGNTVVQYVIDNGKIFRIFMNEKNEIEGLYKNFFNTNFHNAYPLNPDFTVAVAMQELKMGTIVHNDTPFRYSDVIES